MMKMIINTLKQIHVALLIASLTYLPALHAEQLSLPSGDLEAPVVKHTQISHATPAGTRKKITATVTDNVGVKSVILFYRKIGATKYNRKAMINDAESLYVAVMGEDEVTSPGLEYYIQATDLAGNNLLHGYSFSPLVINVDNPIPPASTRTPAITSTQQSSEKESGGISKWVWIGLGVVLLGAAAGGGSDDPAPTGSITISGTTPSL